MLTMVIVALTFSECKKYDEGPGISFRSKQHRVQGEWDITSFTINDIDALHTTNSGVAPCQGGGTVSYTTETTFTRWIWTFEKNDWNFTASITDKQLDPVSTFNSCTDEYTYNDATDTDAGGWKFISNKERIEITFNSGNFSTIAFEIKELREKEMKLEGYNATDLWKITFKKR